MCVNNDTQVQFRKAQLPNTLCLLGLMLRLVDTDKKTAVVHDGSDIGGFELQRARWEVVNANGSLSCGLRWLVDTSSSALTLNMPYESAGAIPHVGDMLELVDFKAT